MRIVNATRGTTVCSSAIVAGNPVRRLAGLMFHAGLPRGSALVLERCNGIHTCFMRFPLDVLFVSRDWRVVRVERAVPPWRFIPWVRGSSRVVELPAGAITESSTARGDVLRPVDTVSAWLA
ncbi:MAG: DUF192 domain-containing protein [Ignavibacteriales bacterium]